MSGRRSFKILSYLATSPKSDTVACLGLSSHVLLLYFVTGLEHTVDSCWRKEWTNLENNTNGIRYSFSPSCTSCVRDWGIRPTARGNGIYANLSIYVTNSVDSISSTNVGQSLAVGLVNCCLFTESSGISADDGRIKLVFNWVRTKRVFGTCPWKKSEVTYIRLTE
jgi:hypothetical protein